MSVNLRDALLNDLKLLPGVREFHLHVLVSAPRKHSTLFQYAQPRCRTYMQDILILLSEQTTPDSPRVLVTAIEAYVYNIPTTSCAMLYISKVDSTGQASYPSPTATLAKSFLLYYTDPATRPVVADHFWIHLFARAQNQYLFPNSSDHPGKRPLSDVKLCSWWKQILTDTAQKLQERIDSTGKALIKLYYILPGYSQLEAEHTLLKHISTSTSSSLLMTHPHQQLSWTYGHPYSQTDIPLACARNPSNPESVNNLGNYIPSFDDDPKSRFLDEIAYTAERERIRSPTRKRPRTLSATSTSQSNVQGSESVLASGGGGDDGVGSEGSDEKSGDSRNGKDADHRPLGELGKVTPDEFWERMSFRQECVAGAVTGFFTLGMSLVKKDRENVDGAGKSDVSPLAPQPGQVSSKINKRIITLLMTGVEFSTTERSTRATETLESTIRGLCEGIASTPTSVIQAPQVRMASHSSLGDRKTPEKETSSAYLAPPRTPPPRNGNGKRIVLPDISPNPFPEPETSLETYNSYIYGSVYVSNAINTKEKDRSERDKRDGTGEHVTVLTARKKKKRAD